MIKAISQPLYYATGLVLMKGVSFFMLPVVAGFLSTEEYGQLDLWLSAINFISIIIGFGLIEALYKFAKPEDSAHLTKLVATCALQQILLAGIAAVIFIAVLFWYLLDGPASLFYQALLAGLTLISAACINIPLSWLRLTNGARQFFILTSFKALGQALFTWYFLSLGWGVTGVLLSAALSSTLLAIVLCVLQFRETGFQWHSTIAKALLTYGYPLVFSGALLFVTAGAERWILAAHVSLAALAQYAIAMQFAMMVAFLTEPLTLWWFPKRFSILNATNGAEKTARYAQSIAHLGIWFAMLIALAAPLFIHWFFPDRYDDAIPLIPWLALGIALKQISHLFNTGCYAKNNTTIVFKLNFLFAILALTLFLITSRFFALTGIVAAFVGLYALRAVAFTLVSQKVVHLPYQYPALMTQLIGLIAYIGLSQVHLSLALFAATLQTVMLLVWFWQAFSIPTYIERMNWARL